MNNLSGQNLGRYHIIEPLGQGGMASVYKAFDTALERSVAIKIIRTDIQGGDEEEFLKRFQREAKALAQLDHPYILKVLDYGEQDGIPYLVMPFVQGGTLKQKMGSRMPYQEAAALLAPIAQALEFAHQQNIVHRDVKPANILISQSGAPNLSDFGIAKILSTGGSTQLTGTGVGIGTPDYMAPEQWMGNAGPKTDIYSLGVVFYEMVTGQLPFSADTPAAVLIKHLRDPLPRPRLLVPDLPEAVEQVLFKALAKEPENRFESMKDFALALEKLSRGESAGASVSLETEYDLPTVMATAPSLHEIEEARKTGNPPPSKKGLEGWKIGLLALTIVVGLSIFCVLAGGAVYASRFIFKGQDPSGTPVERLSSSEPPLVQVDLTLESTKSVQREITNGTFPTQSINNTGTSVSKTPLTTIDGLPADVPLLKENNGDLMTNKSDGVVMYAFTSDLPYEQISEFYKTGMQANNWEVINEVSQDASNMWTYSKGENRMVSIALNKQEDNKTMIIIMLMNQ